MVAIHSVSPQWYSPSSSWIALKMVKLRKFSSLFTLNLDSENSGAYVGVVDFHSVITNFSVSPGLCLYQCSWSLLCPLLGKTHVQADWAEPWSLEPVNPNRKKTYNTSNESYSMMWKSYDLKWCSCHMNSQLRKNVGQLLPWWRKSSITHNMIILTGSLLWILVVIKVREGSETTVRSDHQMNLIGYHNKVHFLPRRSHPESILPLLHYL